MTYNPNWARDIINSGFTNQTTGIKNSELAGEKSTYKGVCSGWLTRTIKLKSGNIKKKQTKCTFETFNKRLDICPECNYALLWKITKPEV